MKKLILTCTLVAIAASAMAQGTVNFANASTTAGWPTAVDRNVKFGATAASYNALLVAGANVSSNYAGVNLGGLRAQLGYGSGTDFMTYTLAPDSLATFKGSTSTTAGSWFSKNPVTLNGFNTGQTANMVVFVWDTAFASSPTVSAATSGLWGVSSIFQYTIPAGNATADQYLMANLGSFQIGMAVVPEPSTFALLGLGALGMLIFRRK